MTPHIGGKTQLAGLIGWPVAHSLSPAMHNAAAADLGLDLAYVPMPVRPDQLAPAVRGLAALGFRGANVTVPHKETVLALLDQIDPAAAAVGAVNTIVISYQPSAVSHQPSAFSGQPSPATSDQQPAPDPQSPITDPILTGYNTDWSAFLADVQASGLVLHGRESLVLGAGGSARAVAYALATAGSRVHLLSRREEQAREVVTGLANHCPAGSLAAHPWTALGDNSAPFAAAALVVNSTPLGMAPNTDASPWPGDLPLPNGAFIYDLVYNPAETKFMQQARAGGHQSSNGLGMLLRQGALAFKLWTGLDPDLAVMAKALQIP